MAGAIAFSLGATLGTVAGFAGGRTETLIMRIIGYDERGLPR